MIRLVKDFIKSYGGLISGSVLFFSLIVGWQVVTNDLSKNQVYTSNWPVGLQEQSLKSRFLEESLVFETSPKIEALIENPRFKSLPVQSAEGQWNGDCRVKKEDCVACNKGELYCRLVSGNKGYKGWACQNNNPGNLRSSSYACGSRGGFAVFRDYSRGRYALKRLILTINSGKHSSYPKCGKCTLYYFFRKYAPSGDGNDPDYYAELVAERMGISPYKKLSWVVNNGRIGDLMEAIQWREGWFTISPDKLEEFDEQIAADHEVNMFYVTFGDGVTKSQINLLNSLINSKEKYLYQDQRGYRLKVELGSETKLRMKMIDYYIHSTVSGVSLNTKGDFD